MYYLRANNRFRVHACKLYFSKKKIENTVQAFCKLKIESIILGKRNRILRKTVSAHLYYNTSKGTLKNSLIFFFSGGGGGVGKNIINNITAC